MSSLEDILEDGIEAMTGVDLDHSDERDAEVNAVSKAMDEEMEDGNGRQVKHSPGSEMAIFARRANHALEDDPNSFDDVSLEARGETQGLGCAVDSATVCSRDLLVRLHSSYRHCLLVSSSSLRLLLSSHRPVACLLHELSNRSVHVLGDQMFAVNNTVNKIETTLSDIVTILAPEADEK